MNKKPKYDASNIKVLSGSGSGSGLDAIRSRPGMYLGDTEDCSYLILYVFEYLKLATKEVGEEPFTSISILIKENNWVEIKVNGNGLPIESNKGTSLIEKLLTEPHFNYFEKFGVYISGLAVVNALSTQVEVTNARDGNKWQQTFKDGEPKPIKNMGKVKQSGLTIRFLPNKKYFTNLYFNQTKIAARLEELSYLHEGLSINFEDRSIRKVHFHNSKGLNDYLAKITTDTKNCKIRTGSVQIIDNSMKFEVVFVFSRNHGHQISFVNDERTIKGGTHQKGLISGVAQVFKKVSGCKKSSAIWKPIIEQGLISVLSVYVNDPQWSGSTKDKLINKEVYNQTKSFVAKNLLGLINKNEALRDDFKKLFVDEYLMVDYKKQHDKYGFPTADYAKKMLKALFNKPSDYDFIVEQYKEFDRVAKECLKQQNNKSAT